ncbi:hypothetical protein N7465_002111 [Penicillium sp. CMV-2018d]|nr:hypothetical protein N7465_002111 [Penicillium sp. CMV-2018d]
MAKESNEIEAHFRYDLSEGSNVKFKPITALGAWGNCTVQKVIFGEINGPFKRPMNREKSVAPDHVCTARGISSPEFDCSFYT